MAKTLHSAVDTDPCDFLLKRLWSHAWSDAHSVFEGHFKGLQPEVGLMRLDNLPWPPQLHPHHGHVQLIIGIQQSPLCQGQRSAAKVQLALILQDIKMCFGLTH